MSPYLMVSLASSHGRTLSLVQQLECSRCRLVPPLYIASQGSRPQQPLSSILLVITYHASLVSAACCHLVSAVC